MKRAALPAEAAPNPSKRQRPGPRAFAHVDGNWPSLVYIKVDRCAEGMAGLAAAALAAFSARCPSPVPMPETELHISLSRPFVLRLHQIDPFLTRLAMFLARYTRSEGGPLACALHPEYCVLSNEDRSKSFVAVPLGAGDATRQLSELVECVDAALADFQQPPYYKAPRFHVTIGSMHPAVEPVQERDGAVVSLLTALDGEAPAMFPYNSDTEEEDSPQSVSDECPVVLLDTVRLVVAELQCKIGNRIYVYPIGAVGSPSWRLLDPKRVKEPDIL